MVAQKKKKRRLQPKQILQAVQYSEKLIDTTLWIGKADELINAANLLREEVIKYWSEIKIENGKIVGIPNRKNVQQAYFLLITYALENFLKVLLVHQNQKKLKGLLHQKLPDYLLTHDLIKLSLTAGFKINLYEEELFCRLTRFSIWKARYPIPINSDILINVKILSDEKAHFTDYYKPQDIHLIDNIIDRLRKHVLTEISKGNNEK